MRIFTSRKKGGRPAHQPTGRDRDFVLAMAGAGVQQDEIARVIRVSDNTLRKHYAYELDVGESRANAEVTQSLFLQAVGGPKRQWDRAVTTASIYWSKVRMRWQEPKQGIELLGDVRIESLSDRQLDVLLERIVDRRNREIESGAQQTQSRSLLPARTKPAPSDSYEDFLFAFLR